MSSCVVTSAGTISECLKPGSQEEPPTILITLVQHEKVPLIGELRLDQAERLALSLLKDVESGKAGWRIPAQEEEEES